MEMFIVGFEMLRRSLPRIGPYLFIELVLPGGTLLALLLYLYQRWNSSIRRGRTPHENSAAGDAWDGAANQPDLCPCESAAG